MVRQVRSGIKEIMMSENKAADISKKPFQRWTRPVLIAVPVVAIMVALLVLRPWGASLGPHRVMAEAYAATESLQSYRVTGSVISSLEGKTIEQTSE